MKKLFAAAISLAAFASPVKASMQQSIPLIYKGNGAMSTATHVLKTSGSIKAACPHVKIAANAYASAYVLYNDSKTLELMRQTYDIAKKYC